MPRQLFMVIEAQLGGSGKCAIPPTRDFNLWLGTDSGIKPNRSSLHYDWHWVWDTGNGELGNNNIHMVDICRWLMGLTGLGESVFSIGGRFGSWDAGETPNTQVVVHGFGPITIIQEVRVLKSVPFDKPAKSGYVIYRERGASQMKLCLRRTERPLRRSIAPGGNTSRILSMWFEEDSYKTSRRIFSKGINRPHCVTLAISLID